MQLFNSWRTKLQFPHFRLSDWRNREGIAMNNLDMDDEYQLEEYSSCEICYKMHCTGQCLLPGNNMNTSKLIKFRRFLKCRKQAIDTSDMSYMLLGDWVPDDWNEDIVLNGDGPPFLNEMVLARYYHKLANLDEDDMPMGDYMYWEGFRMWGYNPLWEINRKNLPLPMDSNLELIIQSEETSTEEDELEENDNLITEESHDEVTINEEESKSNSLNFIDCPIIDFVIKPLEEEQVYIVEFESDGSGNFNEYGQGKVKFWRINEEWRKSTISTMSRKSKALFKVP